MALYTTCKDHITNLITWLPTFLLNFVEVQLFLTLFSLPIMLVWGLPISLLSFLGNLLFGPVITLFLGVSSLIFFSTLIGLPTYYLIKTLELITHWWLYCMPADNRTWLVGFVKPSVFFMLATFLMTMYLLHTKHRREQHKNVLYLTVVLIGTLTSLSIIAMFKPQYLAIPCQRGDIIACTNQGKLTIVDPGFLGSTRSAASWAQYTLAPTLIREIGHNTIENLVLLKPNGMTFQAAERLCITMGVKTIYLVCWDGYMNKSGLYNYRMLTKTAAHKRVRIQRIGREPITIPSSKGENSFLITPLSGTLTAGEISYPALAVQTQIDNQEITIYSARYKQKACQKGIN
jgi:hypothetical protein